MKFLIGLIPLALLVACGDKDEDTADTAESTEETDSGVEQ